MVLYTCYSVHTDGSGKKLKYYYYLGSPAQLQTAGRVPLEYLVGECFSVCSKHAAAHFNIHKMKWNLPRTDGAEDRTGR